MTELGDARVRLVEPLGDCVDLCLDAASGEVLTARLPPDAGVAPGQSVRLQIDMTKAHFFASGGAGQRLA